MLFLFSQFTFFTIKKGTVGKLLQNSIFFSSSEGSKEAHIGMVENVEITNQKACLVDIKEPNSSAQEINVVKKQRAQALATLRPSFDGFLHSVAIFGSIMFFFYLCDDDHYFPAVERTYSRDLFWFLVLLLFAVAAGLTKKKTADKILNREQTEEWKGWMQVMFVWYHYFKAAETYNAIRVFIAAYVWMTGFGKNTYKDS